MPRVTFILAAALLVAPIAKADAINGCAKQKDGKLRLVADLGQCKSNEIHGSHDVAVLRLGITVPSSKGFEIQFSKQVKFQAYPSTGIVSLPLESAWRFDDVEIGSDIIVFGYPSAIGLDAPQIDYERPLLRRGIVAGKNPGLQTIILDGAVYPGNSGGPVLARIRASRGGRSGLYYRLIGLIVERIQHVDPDQNIKQNSGYSVAEPLDAIEELIARFKGRPMP